MINRCIGKKIYNSSQWQRLVLWLLMAWCMRTQPSGATTHIDLFQDGVLHKFEQKGWCECDNDFKSILHLYSNQRHMPWFVECHFLLHCTRTTIQQWDHTHIRRKVFKWCLVFSGFFDLKQMIKSKNFMNYVGQRFFRSFRWLSIDL